MSDQDLIDAAIFAQKTFDEAELLWRNTKTAEAKRAHDRASIALYNADSAAAERNLDTGYIIGHS